MTVSPGLGLSYGHWSDKETACMDAAMTHPLVRASVCMCLVFKAAFV